MRHRVLFSLLFVALLPAIAAAQGTSDIPSYYRQLDFNLTSPSGWTTAVGGYANPAVYAAMPGSELEWYGTLFDDDGQTGLDRWGLFLGLEGLGFGAVHRRIPTSTGTLSVTDYRLALSAGDRASSFGVSLGWSGGDTDQFRRTTTMQVGMVQRFGRYLSAGLVGTFSTEVRDQSGLADLAVRPFGTDRLTVFGDLELPRGVSLEDAPWSAGAMLQVVPGVSMVGRYFEDESFSVAFAWTFGGDLLSGHVRSSVDPRFDSGGDLIGTNYGIRVGFAERNAVGEYFFRNHYYAEVNLKGRLAHTRYKYFDPSHTLYDVISRLEAARTDDRIAGVVVSLSGASMTRGNAWELREKLRELQRDGKRVVVYFDEAGMTLYHLASVADVVVMDPEGTLVIPGYVMGRTFIRGMLDKMDVGIEEWRLWKYKSAMEAFTRHSMSEADSLQRQALVDQYYRTMTGDVAASREVSAATVDGWIDDVTVFTAGRALESGLVDRLARWDDVEDVVQELDGEKKRLAPSGLIDPSRYASRRWGVPPRVAVVYALGACDMDSGIHARRLEDRFNSLKKDASVKAVVLRVVSPGGSGLASDLVAKAMRECAEKKPVVVSQGDVAASGGYWISMYGTEILVQPTTVTGSIGVIGGWVWDDGLGDRLGMEGDFVKKGKHADAFFPVAFPFVGVGLPHRALTDEEHERVYAAMRELYGGFVEKVSQGRGMSNEEVREVAQGRVWTGVQGVENGLADRIGGLQDAIDIALERAGYERGGDITIVNYGTRGLFDLSRLNPVPLSWLTGLFSPQDRDAEDQEAFLFAGYDALYLRELARNNGRPLCMIPPDFVPAPERGAVLPVSSFMGGPGD